MHTKKKKQYHDLLFNLILRLDKFISLKPINTYKKMNI